MEEKKDKKEEKKEDKKVAIVLPKPISIEEIPVMPILKPPILKIENKEEL